MRPQQGRGKRFFVAPAARMGWPFCSVSPARYAGSSFTCAEQPPHACCSTLCLRWLVRQDHLGTGDMNGYFCTPWGTNTPRGINRVVGFAQVKEEPEGRGTRSKTRYPIDTPSHVGASPRPLQVTPNAQLWPSWPGLHVFAPGTHPASAHATGPDAAPSVRTRRAGGRPFALAACRW